MGYLERAALAGIATGMRSMSAIAALIWVAGVMFIRHELSLYIGPLFKSGLESVTSRCFPGFWPQLRETDRR